MEIILRQDVIDLGYEGDIVKVADGYARNYLIPKEFAVKATSQNLRVFEQNRRKIEIKRLRAKEEAEQLKAKLEELELIFLEKTGEDGKLYGSVTNMAVASALEAKDVIVDRKKIVIDEVIKTVGEHKASIKLYPGVTATIKLIVNPLEEKRK